MEKQKKIHQNQSQQFLNYIDGIQTVFIIKQIKTNKSSQIAYAERWNTGNKPTAFISLLLKNWCWMGGYGWSIWACVCEMK